MFGLILDPGRSRFRNREEEIERTIRFLAPLNYTDIINRSSRHERDLAAPSWTAQTGLD